MNEDSAVFHANHLQRNLYVFKWNNHSLQYVEAYTQDKRILLRISIEPKFIQNLTLKLNFLNKLINIGKKKDVWEDFKPEMGRQHMSFEGERSLLPELQILGWLRFSRAFDQGLKPDVHEQEYEIHYIVKGKLNW